MNPGLSEPKRTNSQLYVFTLLITRGADFRSFSLSCARSVQLCTSNLLICLQYARKAAHIVRLPVCVRLSVFSLYVCVVSPNEAEFNLRREGIISFAVVMEMRCLSVTQ